MAPVLNIYQLDVERWRSFVAYDTTHTLSELVQHLTTYTYLPLCPSVCYLFKWPWQYTVQQIRNFGSEIL